MKKPKSPSKASVRRAADRAEGRIVALGEDEPEDLESPSLAPKAVLGRPTAFRPEYVDHARKLCRSGHTDREVADFFEISIVTLNNWKAEFPDFLKSIQNAKDIADERVERSLYHRAVGYTYEAEELFQYQGEILRAKVRKHVPPDTASMIFWLKNRRKDQWRDVHRHEFGRAGEFDKLSDAELVTELAKTAQLLLTDQTEKDKEED